MAQRFNPFIPADDQSLDNWLEEYRTKLLEHAATLGLEQTININVPANSTENIITGDFTDLMTITIEVTSVPGGGPPPMPPSSLFFQMVAEITALPDLATAIEVVPGTTITKTIAELGGAAGKRFLNVRNPSPTVPGTSKVSLPDEKTMEQSTKIVGQLSPSIQDVITKRNDWQQAAELKENFKQDIISGIIRPFIQNKIKASDTFTTDIGKDIGIIAEAIVIDPATMQPELKLIKSGDGIIVKWKKGAADSIRLEVDRGSGFQFLAIDTQPDYTDTFALPETPATWKYRGIYQIKDQAVGLMSQVVYISLP